MKSRQSLLFSSRATAAAARVSSLTFVSPIAMPKPSHCPPNPNQKLAGDDFYRVAIEVLQEATIPFVVGGAYALRVYAEIVRDTKDFDIFVRERDLKPALDAFERTGFSSELTYPHWLAKAHCGDCFVDLIFRAGNGLCDVDDTWFERARPYEMLGKTIALCPPEEIILMKSYIMERERFDGADIMHILRRCAETLRWKHLLERFGPDWRVLLSHLVMFGFVYPSERNCIPAAIMDELLRRLREEQSTPPNESDKLDEKICNGTLISRAQYLPDIERWGYRDGRRASRVRMTEQHIADWTDKIEAKDRPQ